MSQTLKIGPDKYITIDRSWKDNGKDAEWAFVGGQKIKIAEQARAKPEIFQRGNEFFYSNGEPVTVETDVDYLPEPFRSTAVKFIQTKAEKIKEIKTFPTKEVAVLEALKKGPRGSSNKKPPVPGRIDIHDEDSYTAAGGVVV